MVAVQGMHQVGIEKQGLVDLGQDNMDQIEQALTIEIQVKTQIIVQEQEDMEATLANQDQYQTT